MGKPWKTMGKLWENTMENKNLASGKLTVCFGKSPSLIGKPTLNHLFSAIFHSYVCLPEGTMKNIDGWTILKQVDTKMGYTQWIPQWDED